MANWVGYRIVDLDSRHTLTCSSESKMVSLPSGLFASDGGNLSLGYGHID